MKRHCIIEEDLAVITGHSLPWNQFAGRTVLVAGASGLLPAYMVETLLYLNEHGLSPQVHVVGLVRNRARAETRFAAYRGRTDLELLEQDVCVPVRMEGRVDFVIHAASQASPKYYGTDPAGTVSANVQGTQVLLELARTKGSENFLLFSAGEVYGRVDPSRIPTREEDFGPLDPIDLRSCYAEGKRLAETLCVCWAHQHHVPARIVRPFHTYGPGLRLDDGRVFSDFVADIVNNRDIVLLSDGSARRAFCYLADATVGFFTVLLKGKSGQAYNIGNDKGETSMRELAEILTGLFPERGLHVVQRQTGIPVGYLQSAVHRTCPEIAKARSLGWEPTTSVPDGFRRTVRSFL